MDGGLTFGFLEVVNPLPIIVGQSTFSGSDDFFGCVRSQ
jgi:hypothetical protein